MAVQVVVLCEGVDKPQAIASHVVGGVRAHGYYAWPERRLGRRRQHGTSVAISAQGHRQRLDLAGCWLLAAGQISAEFLSEELHTIYQQIC